MSFPGVNRGGGKANGESVFFINEKRQGGGREQAQCILSIFYHTVLNVHLSHKAFYSCW